ncbi:MAG: hypothetical protein QOF89_1596 [Acidobacteriota bacterium]|jgi:hypothetical protein|nr:hypothetical protein [Acidobacteriota bacterium]
MQLGLILDGESGEVSIRRELPGDPRAPHEAIHQVQVPGARVQDLSLGSSNHDRIWLIASSADRGLTSTLRLVMRRR